MAVLQANRLHLFRVSQKSVGKYQAQMKSQIVRFYFLKVDGTIREAWGTICPDIVPPTEHTTNRKANDTVQVYYDLEKQEYRSFKKFNLVSIESYPWR